MALENQLSQDIQNFIDADGIKEESPEMYNEAVVNLSETANKFFDYKFTPDTITTNEQGQITVELNKDNPDNNAHITYDPENNTITTYEKQTESVSSDNGDSTVTRYLNNTIDTSGDYIQTTLHIDEFKDTEQTDYVEAHIDYKEGVSDISDIFSVGEDLKDYSINNDSKDIDRSFEHTITNSIEEMHCIVRDDDGDMNYRRDVEFISDEGSDYYTDYSYAADSEGVLRPVDYAFEDIQVSPDAKEFEEIKPEIYENDPGVDIMSDRDSNGDYIDFSSIDYSEDAIDNENDSIITSENDKILDIADEMNSIDTNDSEFSAYDTNDIEDQYADYSEKNDIEQMLTDISDDYDDNDFSSDWGD